MKDYIYETEDAHSFSRFDQDRFLVVTGDGPSRIDYSVLSVAVMTLGLIMMVEVGRHRLDHAAMGRPFFTAVLEGVYAELATLGMVEFFIFLLHKYYEDLDIAKEQVFANVHFTLFYTAVLNAFQSVILAFLTMRISHRMWVQTETLELNHYVEIREEFELVSAQLEQLKYKPGSGSSTSGETPEVEDEQHPKSSKQPAKIAGGGDSEFVFEFSIKGVRKLFGRLLDRIKYPRIKSKHDQLLVQIRFHELRVHFLQAYKLPLKLRISDYLIRSEQQVLIKLVHVSTVAWLLLTAAMNVLYFCLGIVAYKTEDGEIVGTAMIWIFFWCLLMFLLLAFLVYNKMKSIFRTIMHKKTLWSIQDDGELKEELAQEQLSLFWGGDPTLVIAAIQFMQFGFAILLSVLLIFWEAINDGGVAMPFYLITVFVGYTLFVTIVAKVIPRYTLCTSLGQLVNQQRLDETVALFRLEESRRQRLEQIEVEGYEGLDVLEEDISNRTVPPPPVITAMREGVRQLTMSATEGIKNVAQLKMTATEGIKNVISANDSAALMAELVKLDTSALRTNLPVSEREELSKRETARARRKGRRTVSEGVGAMAAMGGSMSVAAHGMLGNDDSRPKKTLDDFALPVQKSSGLEMKSNELLVPKDAKAERLERRHRRKKSMSDGVAAMAWTHSKPFNESDLIPPSVPEEEEEVMELPTDAARPTARNAAGFSVFDATVPHSNVGALVEIGSVAHSGERSQAALRPIQEAGYIGPPADADGLPTHYDPLTAPNAAGLFFSDTSMPHSNVGTLVDIESFVDSGEPSQAALHPIQEAGFAEPLVDADDISIKSARSVDGSEDGHSDVDDVPEVDPSFIQKPDVIYTPGLTLREKFRAYYLSKRFVLVSNVFGTLVAFFLVGQRIEKFLHSEGIISDEFITFGFDNEITFWTLTTWLVLFLETSGMIFYSLRPFKGFESNRERSVVLAAGIDAVLTSVCLTVFFVAESQRCCNPDDDSPTSSPGNGRSLAGDGPSLAGDDPSFAEPVPCGCPTFGSRRYGGLGSMEPFVALLGLRIFRHAVARRIVRFMDSKRDWSVANPMGDSYRGSLGMNIDPFDVFGGHGATVDMEKEVGTISALWELAIGKFPDIVAKHGEFSGELLQAMLGLVVIDTSSEKDGGANYRPIEPDGEGPKDVALLDAGATTSRPFVGEAQYSGLSPDAQEIIMAGRVGRKVMSVRRLPAHTETDADPGSFLTRTGGMGNLYFKLDTSTPVHNDADSIFTAPNARLVRSMRRCDRKLLPILDKWVVVDVVMTRFEMVYFDVNGVDEVTQEALENTRQALIATKGGKGLRLCDVAFGRRVVGLLQFSDVSSAHVKRDTQGSDGEHDDSSDIAKQTEYWKHHIKADGTYGVLSSHWNNITQDVLKIQTVHGHTLYLRFYSDLEYTEGHPLQVLSDSEEKDIIIKNNAFQWIQTIVRYCGPEQLHQPLPHFGDDNDDELRDYLITLHEGDSKHGHRRTASSGDTTPRRHVRLPQLGIRARPGFIRRASTLSSMDDILTAIGEGSAPNDLELPHRPLRARFHRSASTGEAPDSTDRPGQLRAATFNSSKKGSVSFSDELVGSASHQQSAPEGGRGTDEETPIVFVPELSQQEIEEDDNFFGP